MSGSPSQRSRDERRAAILEAAVGVFFRFGLGKTTMDDVARAAGLSRQGLYLQFASKDELFEAAVRHAVFGAVSAAKAALGGDGPLRARLLDAFLAYSGLHFTHMVSNAHLGELMAAAVAVCGDALEEAHADFVAAIARAVKDADAAGAGVSAHDVAVTLVAAAGGLKHERATREAFRAALRTCIKVVLREQA